MEETTFIEVEELEAQLKQQCRAMDSELEQLRSRNADLRQRNIELRELAKTGWEADVEIQRLRMGEAELRDEISSLRTDNQCVRNEAQRALQLSERKAHESQTREASHAVEIGRMKTALEQQSGVWNSRGEQLETQILELNETLVRKNGEILALRTSEVESLNALSGLSGQNAHQARLLRCAVSEIQTMRREFAKQREELSRQARGFERQLSEFAESGWETELQLKRLVTECATKDSRISECEIKMTELNRALECSELERTRQSEARDAQVSLAQESVAQRDGEIRSLRAIEKDASEEILELRAEMVNLRARVDGGQSEIPRLAKLCSERDLEIQTLRAHKMDLNQTVSRLQANLYEVAQSYAELESELSERLQVATEKSETLALQLAQAAEQVTAQAAAQAKEQLEQRDLQLMGFRVIERDLRTALCDKEALHAQLNGEFKAALEGEAHRALTLEGDLRTARRAHAEQESQLAQVRDENAELHKRETESRERSRGLSLDLATKTRTLDELNGCMLNLERSLDGTRVQLEATRVERDSLRQLLETRGTRVEIEQKELQRWSTQLQQREQQLKNYAHAVTQEKAQVMSCSQQLAGEIHSARTLHPLKDYLSLTEFELSKLEVQLKKTPMLSSDRPQLEACLTQMVEQRDFLRSAISQSQRQLDHQAATLLRIAQPDQLAPVPPLPPRPPSGVESIGDKWLTRP